MFQLPDVAVLLEAFANPRFRLGSLMFAQYSIEFDTGYKDFMLLRSLTILSLQFVRIYLGTQKLSRRGKGSTCSGV